MEKVERCNWAQDNLLLQNYHDSFWGKPVHDDKILFKYLILEGAQAGLSWLTVLKKEQDYQKVFFDYNIDKIIGMTDKDLDEIKLGESTIIKNRLKIYSVRTNAQKFKNIQKEFGSFNNYIWSFTEYKSIDHKFTHFSEIPSQEDLSVEISKDLKKRGFKFVGPTIIYSYLQAIGIYNDHLKSCLFR